MLFDLKQASITINYTYEVYDTNNTLDDLTDDSINDVASSFILNFIRADQSGTVSGNAVNTLINEEYPSLVANALDTGDNAARIFLKGAAGTTAKVNLFEPQDGGMDIINEIKQQNWVINEANLVFHVDRDAIMGDNIAPPRIYLYNRETGRPIFNPLTELSTAESLFGRFLNFNG